MSESVCETAEPACMDRQERIFKYDSPLKALCKMALPTVLSQIILVIYNLADTWFVGLTGNPQAVAAISLCLPVYTLLSAISNLFGIGAASVMARYLGQNKEKKASYTFACAIWSSIIFALLYSLLLAFFGNNLLLLIGADSTDLDFSLQFVKYAIVLGGLPTILSMTMAQLIRAGGNPFLASLGMVIGAISNVILDPIFMFVLLPDGQQVVGAAMATACANCISLAYFLIYFLVNKNNPLYTIRIGRIKDSMRIFEKVFLCGLPSFTMVFLAMVSNCFLNEMISTLGSEAVAGLGIVRKIDQMAYAINQGITQGMLPLLAWCYGAGLKERMHKVVILAAIASETVALVCCGCSLLFSDQLIAIFISNPETIQYGASFLRILCLAIPLYSLTFVIIAWFQACQKNTSAFLLSILHKGSLDIVLYFILRALFGLNSILWAAVISEAFALITGIVLAAMQLKKQHKNQVPAPVTQNRTMSFHKPALHH